MPESARAPSLAPVYDVTEVASLRKRVGHAATALKFIGLLSAFFVFIDLADRINPLGSAFAIIFALLTLAGASLIAKRLRSGSICAAALAAICWVLFAASLVHDALMHEPFPKTPESMLGAIMCVSPLYFLGRGLVAFARYRTYQRHDQSLTDPLALNPYEEGLRIKKRPKFINKQSLAGYGLLILSPLPFALLFLLQHMDPPSFRVDEGVMAFLGAVTGEVAGSLAMIVWGVLIYRRGRRAAMLPGSELMKQDARPLVLYLRSFGDDSMIKSRARATNGRILLERLLRIPFEEIVTDHLWGYGPVLAIGSPRTRHGPIQLGAARDYVDDLNWKQKVTELMQRAAMIVVIVGGTEGLAWEVDAIVRLGLASKLVLLLPPVRLQELDVRWRSLASHAIHEIAPLQIDFTRARAVFFPKGSGAVIFGRKRNDWTYEAVLDEAALLIFKEGGTVHSTAPSPQRRSLARKARQVLGGIASDLPNMAGSALVVSFLALPFVWVIGATQRLPLGPEARDSLVAEMLNACRNKNSNLSVEMSTRYCTCVANNLADVVTIGELKNIKADPSAFRSKATSVANACSSETRSQ
jgi:hypothetical protein